MNDFLQIRLATMDDLKDINLLFKKVIDDLKNIKKINMWNTVYPFCEFENDINNKNMYIIEKENKIIGSFSLTDFDDPEYHIINWKTNNKFFYLNRLVIDPSMQGKGYAKEAMKYINNYAISNNYNVIRLTVHKNNIYAINLYKKYDFKQIENSQWTIGDKIFLGFEKELK